MVYLTLKMHHETVKTALWILISVEYSKLEVWPVVVAGQIKTKKRSNQAVSFFCYDV